MSTRPCPRENIKTVSDVVVWAFQTYGMIPNFATTTRPACTQNENIKSVNEVINWLVGG